MVLRKNQKKFHLTHLYKNLGMGKSRWGEGEGKTVGVYCCYGNSN